MKKIIVLASLLIILNTAHTETKLSSQEACYLDRNGKIVCESEISDGCRFNEETKEVECPKETKEGGCNYKPIC